MPKADILQQELESLTSQIKNLSNKIDKKQEYVYSYQERLTKQFNLYGPNDCSNECTVFSNATTA